MGVSQSLRGDRERGGGAPNPRPPPLIVWGLGDNNCGQFSKRMVLAHARKCREVGSIMSVGQKNETGPTQAV